MNIPNGGLREWSKLGGPIEVAEAGDRQPAGLEPAPVSSDLGANVWGVGWSTNLGENAELAKLWYMSSSSFSSSS